MNFAPMHVSSKSLSSYVRTLTAWHCPHLPAADAAIDRSLLPAGPAAANSDGGEVSRGKCSTPYKRDEMNWWRRRANYWRQCRLPEPEVCISSSGGCQVLRSVCLLVSRKYVCLSVCLSVCSPQRFPSAVS